MLKRIIIILFAFSSTQIAHAEDVFTATINVEGIVGSFGFNKAEDVISSVEDGELMQQFSNYTSNSAATALIDFRGLHLTTTFAQGSTNLVLNIPSLSINQTFNGIDRNDSANQLRDFLIENGGDLQRTIAKELIAKSSVDPLAGNPASLMGRMVDSSFALGISNDAINTITPDNEISKHSFGFSARFGRFNQGGKDIDSISLPLSYSYDVGENRTSRLILSLPISYTRVLNAESASVGLGIALRKRVTKNWSLTPAVSYGAIGSIDLASVGHVISASLSSIYSWHLGKDYGDLVLSLANMGAYYQTLPLKVSNINFDPELQNYVLKNGILISSPIRIDAWNTDFILKGYVTDTQFFGDQLFAEQYNEVGFSFNVVDRGSWMDDFGINATYLFSVTGDDVEGFNFNLGYEF